MAYEDLKNVVKMRGDKTPLKSYLWIITLPSLNDAKQSSSGISERDQYEVSSRILSVSVPYNIFETDKANHGNSFWYYPVSTDIGTITLEVMEYEDGLTFKYFDTWQKMISNHNGTFNPPNYYKRNIRFFRLNNDGTEVSEDVYKGYFVSGIGESANDYESNNVIRYTITLTGDSHFRKILPFSVTEKSFAEAINKAKSLKTSITEFLF